MKTAVVIATVGDQRWADLAREHAVPSVQLGDADSLYVKHVPTASPIVLGTIRNRAAEEAPPSDWLCFLDADDQLAPGYLKAMRVALHRAWPVRQPTREVPALLLVPAVQYVEERGCGLCGGTGAVSGIAGAGGTTLPGSCPDCAGTGRERVCVGDPAIPAWDRSLLDLNCACIGTVMPRWLFNRLDGFRDMPITEDWELWIRAVRSGAKMVPVPDAVYCATRQSGSRNDGPEAVETYHAVRAEHGPGFDWGDLRRYKLPMP